MVPGESFSFLKKNSVSKYSYSHHPISLNVAKEISLLSIWNSVSRKGECCNGTMFFLVNYLSEGYCLYQDIKYNYNGGIASHHSPSIIYLSDWNKRLLHWGESLLLGR